MKNKIISKEGIYTLITVASLVMCVVLIVSVAIDSPVATMAPVFDNHVPVMRSTNDNQNPVVIGQTVEVATQDGVQITCDELKEKMLAYIPKSLPYQSLDVEILGKGGFEIELDLNKADFKAYMEKNDISLGFKNSILLGLLPDDFEMEMVFLCTGATREEIVLSLDHLSLNDKDVGTEFVPQSLLDIVDNAITGALQNCGHQWSNIIFANGMLYLK